MKKVWLQEKQKVWSHDVRKVGLLLGGLTFVGLAESFLGCCSATSDVSISITNPTILDVSFVDDDSLADEYDFYLRLGEKSKLTRKMRVSTNSPLGFTLSVSGTNTSELGANTLTSEEFSTANGNIFNSIAETTTLASFSGNVWGYSLGENYSSADLSFSPVPTEDTQVDATAVGTYSKDYYVTVGVAAASLAAGTYEGSLTFTAAVDSSPVTYAIYYDDNYDGGAGTFAFDASSDSAASHTFTVISQTPTRTGYVFSGWNTMADGSGSSYSAGGSVVVLEANPRVTLYAIWAVEGSDDEDEESDEETNDSNSGNLLTTTYSSYSNPSSSSGSESNSDSASAGQADPQGVVQKTDSSSELITGDTSMVPGIVALSTAALATGGFIFILLGKRDDDDDEEETEGSAQ